MTERTRRGDGKKVAVFGVGNIGSHLIPHLARSPLVGRLVIVDRDSYEAKNLLSQDIVRRDVGKPKAGVQAARARRINPALETVAIVGDVQRVPLGRLRADAILACLDSRQARQFVNQAAWRLGGVPWIDAGVEAEGLLVRVSTYAPGVETACLECLFEDRDYALLEQAYPCDGAAAMPAPTNAPSSLGALAAAMQAVECQKLLGGLAGRGEMGREVILDAAHQKHFVTPLRRNPRCRFDHEVWRIEALVPARHGLAQAANLVHAAGETHPRLWVEGRVFATRSACPRCGAVEPFVHLAAFGAATRLPAVRACAACAQPMEADPTGLVEYLDIAALPETERQRSLASIGLRPGDVFSVVGSSGAKHFEVDGPFSTLPRGRGRKTRDEAARGAYGQNS